MLSMMANYLRVRHIELIVEATAEWNEGYRRFLGEYLEGKRRQCDESKDACVDIADFPEIEEAAWNAVGRTSRQNPDGE